MKKQDEHNKTVAQGATPAPPAYEATYVEQILAVEKTAEEAVHDARIKARAMREEAQKTIPSLIAQKEEDKKASALEQERVFAAKMAQERADIVAEGKKERANLKTRLDDHFERARALIVKESLEGE